MVTHATFCFLSFPCTYFSRYILQFYVATPICYFKQFLAVTTGKCRLFSSNKEVIKVSEKRYSVDLKQPKSHQFFQLSASSGSQVLYRVQDKHSGRRFFIISPLICKLMKDHQREAHNFSIICVNVFNSRYRG